MVLFIISQVVGAISILVGCAGYLVKSKIWLLIILSIANLLAAVASGFLQNWIIVGIGMLAVARGVVLVLLHKYNVRQYSWLSVAVLVAFVAALVVIVVYTRTWWFDWILLAAGAFLIYGNWARGIHMIRIATVVYCALALVNHIVFHNWVAIADQALSITSVVAFYVMVLIKAHKGKTLAGGANIPTGKSGETTPVENALQD